MLAESRHTKPSDEYFMNSGSCWNNYPLKNDVGISLVLACLKFPMIQYFLKYYFWSSKPFTSTELDYNRVLSYVKLSQNNANNK